MFDFFKKKTENNQNTEADVQNQPQQEPAQEQSPATKKNIFSLTFDALKNTIANTSQSLVGNVVQHIEQKVRINLALKGIQLTLSPLILLQDNFFHQFLDLLIGFLDRMAQMADLLRPADINLRLFASLILSD